jgi:hypothetical protein
MSFFTPKNRHKKRHVKTIENGMTHASDLRHKPSKPMPTGKPLINYNAAKIFRKSV